MKLAHGRTTARLAKMFALPIALCFGHGPVKIGLGFFLTPFTSLRPLRIMSDSSSKIIVDDDWKTQVEKEKQLAGGTGAEPMSTEKDVTVESSSAFDESLQPPPDASFETLLTMLFTQGMAALGQLPGGPEGAPQINKPFAKHFIDTIEMLGEKTKGNLSDNESKMLSEILHALRITFVSVKAPK
jgi:hypothetical protein